MMMSSNIPTLGSPAQPPPPTGDDHGGGSDRDRDKLTLMYVLSLFIWARLRPLLGLSRLKRSYVQTLLEELAEDGLVWIGSDPEPRFPRLHWVRHRMLHWEKPPIYQPLRIGLTDAGWAHPPLVKLREQIETDRRERQQLTRVQQILFRTAMVTIMGLVVAYVGVSAFMIIV